MGQPIEIEVWHGDIAELEVDALVIAASESLFMTNGPAASVKRRAGFDIERAAVDQGPISPGSAIVTSGGSLAAPYVIHAVAVGHDRVADPGALASAVRAALSFAGPLQLKSLAVALLGAETGAFAAEDAAAIVVSELRASTIGTSIEWVVLAAANASEARALGEAVRAADAGAGVR